MFHKDKPVDWLLDHILWVKVCSPDKDQVTPAKKTFFYRMFHGSGRHFESRGNTMA